MSLLKWTGKYTLIGLLVLVVIITISVLLFSQRGQKVAESPRVSPDTPSQSPPPSGIKSPSDGHFHADGTWHADPPALAIREDATQAAKDAIKTTRISRRERNANKSSLGWIRWKYASDRDPHGGDNHWERLPEEIKRDIVLLVTEQVCRESLQNIIEEAKQYVKKYGEEMDLDRDIDYFLRTYEHLEPRKLLFDEEGNPLPPFTEAEYKAEELRRLVGDRDLESATQFLERHGHYNELLLSRLDDERAFEYLYTIAGSSTGEKRTRVYAERVVASDPTHLKARLYLADTSPRSSAADLEAALVQYESILADHPDSPHALVEAGGMLTYLDRPVQAIEYLKRGHVLGARHGFFNAGIAYQKLGDYKTAWVYMVKAAQLPHGHGLSNPIGQLRAIEAGQPFIKPLPVEKLDIPKTGSLSVRGSPLPGSGFGTLDDPFVPPPDDALFPDTEKMRAEAEAAARAREQARREEIEQIRQMSDQEIDNFIQWAEQLMQAEAAAARATDFLAQEMAGHLTGAPAQFSPERIVRANEIIQQYGTKEGRQRLKISDPEIAVQIQLLQNQEPIPKIGK